MSFCKDLDICVNFCIKFGVDTPQSVSYNYSVRKGLIMRCLADGSLTGQVCNIPLTGHYR